MPARNASTGCGDVERVCFFCLLIKYSSRDIAEAVCWGATFLFADFPEASGVGFGAGEGCARKSSCRLTSVTASPCAPYATSASSFSSCCASSS